MATTRVKFNWFLIDREAVANYIMMLDAALVGRSITVDYFHSKITKHLKSIIPVRFRKNRDVKVTANQIWIGGSYYSVWDQDKEKCIELSFAYPLFDDNLKLSKHKFTRIAYNIADTLLHEIIHMRQFRRRKFKLIPDYQSKSTKFRLRAEQEYLGCSDEIDAYSFNIACELIDKFGYDKEKIKLYLDENQKGTNRKYNSWRMYLKAFEHDHNHAIIKRVKKKVIRYLPRAHKGKPYRNKTWINR